MRGCPLPALLLALCLAAPPASATASAAAPAATGRDAAESASRAARGTTAGQAADSLQAIVQGVVDANPEIFGAVLLVDGPYLCWRGAAGMADPAAGRAMAAGDQFYLASVAKTMTAALVLKLAEAGRVGLDDPVADYLPDSLLAGLFTVGGRPRHGEVTLRQLL
ncbi:MAG: beta-lactamase family protein, partial [Candidatus Krumholzibacteriota bacterium]|nr:beta-lactamase family protein [Candidatus Krumholzibacteriota bacterium]